MKKKNTKTDKRSLELKRGKPVRVQRVVSPPLDRYFQIPAHQATISAEDFINGKMPDIVKHANKMGHMVRLTVAG